MSESLPSLQTESTRDRRQFYRASIVPRSGLRVRVWRMSPGVPLRQRPMPSQELRVGVRQVCVGGLTVEAPKVDERLAGVRETDRLRIEVAYADRVTLVEGRFRGKVGAGTDAGTDAAAAALRTGVVFQGREADVAYREARTTLANIVGCVQREELRERRRAQVEAAQGTPPSSAAA